MPRERPLLTSWAKLAGRLAPRQGQQLTTFWENVLPVFSVGSDEADEQRPLWHITGGINGTTAPNFPGVTITAAVDIALEALIYWATADFFLSLGTPNSLFNLFENPSTFTFPGIRPRLDFNVGNVIQIQHENSQPVAPVGHLESFNTTSDLQAGGGIFFNKIYSEPRVIRWERPGLILPATMFLTLQGSGTGPAAGLFATHIYREL